MATATSMASGPEMTIGGVLSGTAAAVRDRPMLFLGTGFVVAASPPLVGAATSVGTLSPGGVASPTVWLWPAVLWLLWFFLYTAGHAMLIHAAIAGHEGRRPPARALAAFAARMVLPLIGMAILYSLAVWFGLLLLIVPGVMLALMGVVAMPVLIEEPFGIFAAFNRSQRLTKGARWRIFGLLLVVMGLYFTAFIIVGVASVAVFGAAPTVQSPGFWTLQILSAAIQTVGLAAWAAMQGMLYVALREWKDGPGGERLADIFA